MAQTIENNKNTTHKAINTKQSINIIIIISYNGQGKMIIINYSLYLVM